MEADPFRDDPGGGAGGIVPWSEFLSRFEWRQGEHVSLIGPTGAGKTTLALGLLPVRDYVVALGTKPADETLSALVRQGWTRIESWDDRPPLIPEPPHGTIPRQRLVLWPRFRSIQDQKRHKEIFQHALHAMFREKCWTLFADEVGYLTNRLKLGDELTTWWQQGRSIGLTTVAATQRPAWVPLEMYSQASHLFLWHTGDRRDLERLRDVAGPVGRELRGQVQRLNFHRHEVLYLNVRTGETMVTVPPAAGHAERRRPSRPARFRRGLNRPRPL